jgi:hypothetical protein
MTWEDSMISVYGGLCVMFVGTLINALVGTKKLQL